MGRWDDAEAKECIAKERSGGKMRIEMEMGMQIFGSGDWGSPEKVVFPRAHDLWEERAPFV